MLLRPWQGRSTLGRRLILLAVLFMVVAGSMTALWQHHERAAAAAVRIARCDRFTTLQDARAAAVSGHGARVVVIGDSWSAGYGLPDPDRSWSTRLPGRVYVDGFPGSGFSEHASGCHRVSYADRAPRDLRHGASLVVVEGGLNDFDQSTANITYGFDRLIKELRGHRVVIVGPAMAPSRAAYVPRVNHLLAELSKKADVPYFSTVDLKLTYQADELHPNQAGADAFGDAVAAFIAAHPARQPA